MLEKILAQAPNISNSRKVFATASLGNAASIRLLKKYGFERGENVVTHHDGKERVSQYYELKY